MSGNGDYGAARENVIAQAGERVHALALQGFTAGEIERRLDLELTATEWELLRDIARHEVESVRRLGPQQPAKIAADQPLSIGRGAGSWRARGKARAALAIAVVALPALAVGILLGSALSGGAGHQRRTLSADHKGIGRAGLKSTRNTGRSPAQARTTRSAALAHEGQRTRRPPAAQKRPAPESAPIGAAESMSAAALNDRGFELMNVGRYEQAIPLLRRAVAKVPHTSDLTYAYALYNLGRSLRLAGRARQAIPLLERRLRIDNQRETVAGELEVARREARLTH